MKNNQLKKEFKANRNDLWFFINPDLSVRLKEDFKVWKIKDL